MKTANRIMGGLWMAGGLMLAAAVALGVSVVFLVPAMVAVASGSYAVLTGRV